MIQGKKFIRKKENFVCDVCGKLVKGTGYTDHCPFCLWSKHVDIFPGDRKSDCHGLMKPVSVDQKNSKWRIKYHCQVCGYERENKTQKEDNFEKIIELTTLSKKSLKKK